VTYDFKIIISPAAARIPSQSGVVIIEHYFPRESKKMQQNFFLFEEEP